MILKCKERGRVNEMRPEEWARTRPLRTHAMRKIPSFPKINVNPLRMRERSIFAFLKASLWDVPGDPAVKMLYFHYRGHGFNP